MVQIYVLEKKNTKCNFIFHGAYIFVSCETNDNNFNSSDDDDEKQMEIDKLQLPIHIKQKVKMRLHIWLLEFQVVGNYILWVGLVTDMSD